MPAAERQRAAPARPSPLGRAHAGFGATRPLIWRRAFAASAASEAVTARWQSTGEQSSGEGRREEQGSKLPGAPVRGGGGGCKKSWQAVTSQALGQDLYRAHAHGDVFPQRGRATPTVMLLAIKHHRSSPRRVSCGQAGTPKTKLGPLEPWCGGLRWLSALLWAWHHTSQPRT